MRWIDRLKSACGAVGQDEGIMSTGRSILIIVAMVVVGMLPTWADGSDGQYRPSGMVAAGMMTMIGFVESGQT